MDDDRVRPAFHEAGHAVVAYKETGAKLGMVTIEPGTRFAGCAEWWPVTVPPDDPAWSQLDVTAPFLLWPEPIRRWVELDVIVALAGEAAADVLAPRTGRLPASLVEGAAGIAAALPEPTAAGRLPRLTAGERQYAAQMVSDPDAPSDADKIAELARVAHGPDLASLAAWLVYLEAVTRALVQRHRQGIERLATELLKWGTLNGQAATAAIEGWQS